LELVKNAYDADARKCTVELMNTDQLGGSVRVVDNGDGMDANGIERGWLVLGRSEKSTGSPTRLGRIPVGSKGLGRLAALRMGARVLLTTRPKQEKATQYDLLIDWDEYEDVEVIDDVALTIEKSHRASDVHPGTQILIEDLRTKIGRMDVKRLARSLILLADPFGDDPRGFKPTLAAPEFSDLEDLVRKRYFDDAEYHLRARVNSRGHARASVLDWQGKRVFAATHDDLTSQRQHKLYECPATQFDLWVFLLQHSTFSTRRSSIGEVREWLQEFGGVHLYRNGIKVEPYGSPGHDWLDIDLRRVQSPEERPGTNTSIGRVRFCDTSDVLVEKTDRSGFIEGEAFAGLKSFAQDAMEWMARKRLEEAEKRRASERAAAPKRARKAKRDLDQAIENTPKAVRPALQAAAEAYDRSREREAQQLRKEIQLYRTLSTAGITAVTFAHESSGNPLKIIRQAVMTIERRAKEESAEFYVKKLEKPVASISQATGRLAVLGDATLKLVDHDKRRASRVDIHDVISGILNTFEPFLRGRDVVVRMDLVAGSPYLRASQAAVESIITNLINNSLAAFERASTTKRMLVVRTAVNADILTMSILDNGPGIEGISKSDIWLPGQTTRRNGTGLGLTIVRDAVRDMGGQVDAIEHGALGGAEIFVELPILGV